MEERVKDILQSTNIDQPIVVKGWIRTKRDSKNVVFLAINDGSCMSNIQVVIDKEKGFSTELLAKASTGASVVVKGQLVESLGGQQKVEVLGEELEIVGEAPEDYPLQKKRHTIEFLREIAHLRPRTNIIGAVARVRSAASFAVHKFFQEKGFLYVHTPIITASDCEGAGEMFQVTTMDLNNVPKTEDGAVDFTQDFFGKQTSLTVSGQLSGETYACALSNIYTFGPTFRAENSNTTRHLAEFWMIEPEMAFCHLEGNMDIAEEFIKYVLKYILDNCAEDMAFFDSFVQKGTIDTMKNVIENEFARITYTEAMEYLEKADRTWEYLPKWGVDLQSEHEKYLTEEIFKKPVIVTDYPKEIKAFYMKLNDDGKTVRAMDILVPRLGEIIGGSERESDYGKLEQRIKDSGMDPKDYWWYMDLRKYGTVPHSGFGLGFERLILYVTGIANIRDVIPYPRSVNNANF
ncbi:MAG: asparagine--tRNA ligase [Spirochaetales bacterium]|nr:asparagine--tRNA ligase [Spirochaetales bacterium]